MIDAIEQRLARVEDELAIRNVVARYGMAADCGDTAAALACHTADARYIVSAPRSGRASATGDTQPAAEERELVMQGREAIAGMLESALHRSMLPNCAHTVGPLHISLGNGQAVVVGYSRIYLREDAGPRLLRVAVNRWQMKKLDGSWLIDCRESRLLGEREAQEILRCV